MSKPTPSLLLLAVLTACSAGTQSTIPPDAFRTENVALAVDASRTRELESIRETPPADARQVWLKKDFWIGRKIFLSMGVERASLTGLATSVIGYIPAYLRKVGSTLVLERDTKGLFGGTVLAPEMAINIYPILTETETEILVNLAAPQSPYGLSTSGLHAGANSSTELMPRLEYTKEAGVGPNSVHFTNVVTVKASKPLFDEDDDSAEALVGLDPFLLSMTLRIDWIVAPESPGFQPLPAAKIFGFFTTNPLVSNGGTTTSSFAQRIRADRPFLWEMSASTPETYRPAVEEGLKAWNSSFGRETLQVKMAAAGKSVVDPSSSNLIWDDNRAVGMAFANWRTNPYTGEILQAQIYMSGDMWAQQAAILYKLRGAEKKLRLALANPTRADVPAAPMPLARGSLPSLTPYFTREERAEPRRFFLSFNDALAAERAREATWCSRSVEATGFEARIAELDDMLAAPELIGAAATTALVGTTVPAAGDTSHLPYIPEGMKIEDFQKAVVRNVVMHEAGHTLGLRHNFKGSIASASSGDARNGSVMDYNDLVVEAEFRTPGKIDNAVLKAGYAGSPLPDASAFCTDEDAMLGAPDCFRFDAFREPEEFFRVKQESELLVALRLAQGGNGSEAMNLLVKSVNSIAPLAGILATPTADMAFAQRQRKALDFFVKARELLGLAWPEDIKAEYAGILIQVLASQTNPKAEKSAVVGDLIELFQQTIANADGKSALSVRRAALEGLRRLQSPRGRFAVRMAQSILTQKVQAATAKMSEASFDPIALMEDEELLMSVKKLLDSGYFLSSSRSQ